jgi:hypothetical protein
MLTILAVVAVAVALCSNSKWGDCESQSVGSELVRFCFFERRRWLWPLLVSFLNP